MAGPVSCQEHGFTMRKLRHSEHTEQIRNPNIEIQNKFELPKSKLPKHKTSLYRQLCFEHLRIRILYLFRASDLGFRMYTLC
jgi:hypothetical protein